MADCAVSLLRSCALGVPIVAVRSWRTRRCVAPRVCGSAPAHSAQRSSRSGRDECSAW